QQVRVGAVVAGRRAGGGLRGRGRLRAGLGVADLLQALLGQAFGALRLLAFGADLRQPVGDFLLFRLLLGQAALLLGLFLALALGQVRLLLAAALLLLPLRPARGFGFRRHPLLLACVRFRQHFLRGRLRL